MSQSRGLVMLARLDRLYRTDSLAGVLARGATWSFALQLAGMVMGFGVQTLLARFLTDTDYGIYAYVLGLMNFARIFTKFDFDVTGVKYVAKYWAAEDWGLLRGFHRLAVGFTGALSTFVAATVAVCIWWMGPSWDNTVVVPGLITCAMLPLTTVATVHCGLLQGRRLIVQSSTQVALRPTISFTLVATVVLVFGAELDVARALVIGLVAVLATIGVSSFLVLRAFVAVRGVAPRYLNREWFGASAALVPASLAQLTAGTTLDVVVIGTMIDTTSAGAYAIAAMLLTPAGMVIVAVATIASPVIADLFARPTRDDLRRLAMLIARVNLLLVLPILVAINLMAPFILDWFGPSFRAGVPVVAILSIGTASAVFGGPAAPFLTMTGHHKQASLIIGGSAAFNLVLALLLAPSFGMIGMATATTLAGVARSALLTAAVRRYTCVSLMPI